MGPTTPAASTGPGPAPDLGQVARRCKLVVPALRHTHARTHTYTKRQLSACHRGCGCGRPRARRPPCAASGRGAAAPPACASSPGTASGHPAQGQRSKGDQHRDRGAKGISTGTEPQSRSACASSPGTAIESRMTPRTPTCTDKHAHAHAHAHLNKCTHTRRRTHMCLLVHAHNCVGAQAGTGIM